MQTPDDRCPVPRNTHAAIAMLLAVLIASLTCALAVLSDRVDSVAHRTRADSVACQPQQSQQVQVPVHWHAPSLVPLTTIDP